MIFGGFQKLTLLDFPGRVACTLFTKGCNFYCPFCHNAFLVDVTGQEQSITSDEVLDYLEKRRGILDGVCISGGEPLLHKELEEFLVRVKALGYAVKLDTNGSFPDRLKALAEKKLIDYVAMDIKNSFEKYPLTAGCPSLDLSTAGTDSPTPASSAAGTPLRNAPSADAADAPLGNTPSADAADAPSKAFLLSPSRPSLDLAAIRESIDFLLGGTVDYEFRTTVVAELHTPEDIAAIAKRISGAKRYYLQNFVDSGHIIGKNLNSVEEKVLKNMKNSATKYVKNAAIRGEN